MRWAIEQAPNPHVVRIHVDDELTTRTIVTCPPADPPAWLAPVLRLKAVRSIDLHRYRARVNLRPGTPRAEDVAGAIEALAGPPADLPPEEPPRAFAGGGRSRRRVAESLEMARGDPLAERLLATPGIAEAILGDGATLVRLGRLFRWRDLEATVARIVGEDP